MDIENDFSTDGLSGGSIVEEILDTLPVSVALAIRLAAIPNNLNILLADSLAGQLMSGERLVQALNTLGLGQPVGLGRFHFHKPIRDHLRAGLRRDDNERFRAGNLAALTYFREQADQATILSRSSFQGEILYHMLAHDESEGISLLQELFEEARSRYQMGLAEEYLGRARLQEDSFESSTREWLGYFQARLDIFHGRKDKGEVAINELSQNALDPGLIAVANWSRGDMLYQGNEWSKGIELLQKSLGQLRKIKLSNYTAEVMLSLGEAYQDLARNSGGLEPKIEQEYGLFNQLAHGVQHLPFLILEGLIRRVSFMPRWYAGTNYQDWIVSRLLVKASGWYRKAERGFDPEKHNYGLIRAQLSRAEAEHDLGHWSRARKQYKSLNKQQAVRSSLYRTAQVQLGQGQAFLAEKKLEMAEEALTSALGTFLRFDDNPHAGEAAARLGFIYRGEGRLDEAADSYLTSIRSYMAVDDQVEATKVSWSLTDLLQRSTLGVEHRDEISEFLAAFDGRQYIERFPVKLQKNFRILAYWAALPLTYLVAIFLSFLLSLIIAVVESSIILPLTGRSPISILFEILTIIIQLTLPILLTLWLYRLIYTLTGFAYVRVLGRNVDNLQEDQPRLYNTNSENIQRYETGIGAVPSPESTESIPEGEAARSDRRVLSWSEISRLTSLEIKLSQRPIELASSWLLLDKLGNHLDIDGITTGYERLKGDITGKLGEQAGLIFQNLDFMVLKGRWLILTIVLALAIAIALAASGKVSVTVTGLASGEDAPFMTLTTEDSDGNEAPLPISSVLVGFGPTALLIFAPVTFWRLLIHTQRVKRESGLKELAFPTWWFLFAAIVGTIVAVLWVLLVTVFITAVT